MLAPRDSTGPPPSDHLALALLRAIHHRVVRRKRHVDGDAHVRRDAERRGDRAPAADLLLDRAHRVDFGPRRHARQHPRRLRAPRTPPPGRRTPGPPAARSAGRITPWSITIGSPTETLFSASFWFFAPMSTHRSVSGRHLLAVVRLLQMDRHLADDAGHDALRRADATRWPCGICGSQPPIGATHR